MSNHDITCYACNRRADGWVVHKGKWLDCCFHHMDMLEKGPQTLLKGNQQRKDWREEVIVFCLKLAFLVGFIFTLAYTCAGWFSP